MKIIAATVYERERETDRDDEVRQKMKGVVEVAGRTERPMQTNRKALTCKKTAAALFVHGENKQETNQLQKLMFAEITANLPF